MKGVLIPLVAAAIAAGPVTAQAVSYERERRPDLSLAGPGWPGPTFKGKKGQAILMTLAANSVLVNRQSDEYRDVKKRWMVGDYKAVVAERKQYLN